MKIRIRFTLRLILAVVLFFGFNFEVQAGKWISLRRIDPGGTATKVLQQEVRAPETRIKEANLKGIRKTVTIDYEIFTLLHNRIKRVGNDYDLLEVGDCAPATAVGQPALPVKTIFVEIPQEHDFKVTVNEGERVVLNDYYFLPSQPAPADQDQRQGLQDPEFVIDEGLYQQDRMYPVDRLMAARRIRLRDHELLEIRFTPLRFNPRRKTIEATTQATLDIELYPQSSYSAKGLSGFAGLVSSGFDQGYQGGIFSCIPKTRDLANDIAKAEPEIYMLIFADQFAASPKLKEFCAWKRQKGYRVVEVPTSRIPAAQRGAPTHKELVAYLRALPEKEYPLYLLLLGDQRRDQGVEGYYFKTYNGGYSDLFLACRDDNDFLPDLFHGRLPASNPAELEIMLGKLLKMDRDLPATGPYGRILVAGQVQDAYVNDSNPRVQRPDGVADRLFCETADAVACYFEKNGHQCVRAMVNPGRISASGRWNKQGLLWSGEEVGSRIVDFFISNQQAGQQVTDQINQGVVLIQHRDHGYELGWGDPAWTVAQVFKLQNSAFQPLFFSINCLTGRYNTQKRYQNQMASLNGKNFTKELLALKGGGAHAVMAAVDVSYSWYNDYLTHGFYSAFLEDYLSSRNQSANPDWSKDLPIPQLYRPGQGQRLGEILNQGKLYLYQNLAPSAQNIQTRQSFLLFHLFGDPEAFIQFFPPKIQQPKFPATIKISTGNRKITIENLAQSARVALYRDDSSGQGLQMVTPAVAGQAVFELPEIAPGPIQLTITGAGLKPFIGRIEVVKEGGAQPPQPQPGGNPPPPAPPVGGPNQKPEPGWQVIIDSGPSPAPGAPSGGVIQWDK
ncbi:MAG: C25 family cysteine peptidase [Pseudomonadota bacterium]|nr:C25 family cysteine peptidase [Pseudomonadota bacterium]